MTVRRVAAVASVALLAAGAYAPATAAPKPKPFSGTYTVTLAPDPVINVWSTAGKKNCYTLNPGSADTRTVKLPRAGRLTVVLDSAQDTALSDWDLYVLDKAGDEIGSSSGPTAHEEVGAKLKKAQEITIAVCNLTGSPSGKVTYQLT